MRKKLARWRMRIRLAILALLIAPTALAAPTMMALMGDAGEASRELNALRHSVWREGIQSIVMPGDNLYSGTYADVWGGWKRRGFRFDVIAIGNHNDGYDKEIAYFNMPKEYYSVVKGGARFIVLNSDNKENVESQFRWLEREMQRAEEKMIFLVYHHPTYTIAHHAWTERKDFQIRMRDFLARNEARITALILGHDHLTSFMKFGNIPVIVAGSGREARKVKPVSYEDSGVLIQTAYLGAQEQQWVALEISEDGQQAMAHAIRVKDQARVCSIVLKGGGMGLESNCPASPALGTAL